MHEERNLVMLGLSSYEKSEIVNRGYAMLSGWAVFAALIAIVYVIIPS